jgi:hypothetical protein
MKAINGIGAALAAGILLMAVSAQATPVFQGRLADGTASSTCTVSGATKCTSFYDSNLNITILNNWAIGTGIWSATAAAGSTQALAGSAGLAATGLTGWVLPTADGTTVAGGMNQFFSIWSDVGGTQAALQAQFDGVQADSNYWSSVEYQAPFLAWGFVTSFGGEPYFYEGSSWYAVAVRPGDVAAAVPEPQTLALVSLALGAMVVARRRRLR